ncbi:hypothetical protein V6N13_121315 [Hibiscus sabdariffa]
MEIHPRSFENRKIYHQIYTKFLRADESFDWSKIKEFLDGSVNGGGSANVVDAYRAEATIEPVDGDTPTVKATLTHFA